MTYTFNLIDQPWIPCVDVDLRPIEVSLRELLVDAHRIRTIAAETPLMNAAILPIALAVLHRVFGPAKSADWEDLWEGSAFPAEPLDGYFMQWYDRFDLFHPERPFYQVADERLGNKLIMHLADSSGGAGTLFRHDNEISPPIFTPAQAAMKLLTAQSFRLGGGISGKPTPNFVDSHWTRGILFFAVGRTLFETLMLNLLPYPSKSIMPQTPEDRPFWEADDPFQGRKPRKEMLHLAPKGYLDYLTWQTNHVLLLPEERNGEVIVQWMRIVPVAKCEVGENSPHRHYYRKSENDPWSFLYFNPDRGLWRDYHSLTSLDSENVKPPAIMDWLARLALNGIFDNASAPRVAAVGMLAEKAKPIFQRQELMPLPTHLLNDVDCLAKVRQALDLAEKTSRSINDALKKLARRVLMRDSEQDPDPNAKSALVKQWDVISLYWSGLEPEFWQFIAALSTDPDAAIDAWESTLRDAARSTLATAADMAGTSTAALRGRVEAERLLNGKLKKLFDANKGGK